MKQTHVNLRHYSEDIEPAIVPLQSLGIVDIEGQDISSSELMAHALSNTCSRTAPEDFRIHRGSAFINEYARVDTKTGLRNDGGPGNANHLLGSFPTLFPYGMGGLETDRPINVPYETHVRWTMLYADRRFRTDIHFPFQVFGVMQKREVCRSAVLQMKKGNFQRNMDLISTLRKADLIIASQEETKNVRFSNPAVRALREELSAVRTRVKGTDESRQSVRSKIWGMNLLFNPPSLWVTINPADTQDPIAQVFAGEDIDLNVFCNTAGPDHKERARNIAADPLASAQYFHFIIKCVTEVLLGIKKRKEGQFDREYGVLGKVQSYIGTVEAQGRGTLHLHTLIWLKDAPTSKEMVNALKSEEFRTKMTKYICAMIKSDINGKTNEEVKSMTKIAGISYSRPVDPRNGNMEAVKKQEMQLARALQYHECTATACLKIVKGRLQCKRRAPFPKALKDWVDEEGNWGAKRICEYLNNWNSTIMNCLRCNHDIKLIMSGSETATITYYITNYATKKQQRSSNTSALLADSIAFSKEKDKRQKDLNLINKRLIQRCANSLTRYREFSAPEIMSYIMGYKDVYETHHFVTIFWDPAMRSLKEAFPDLQKSG